MNHFNVVIAIAAFVIIVDGLNAAKWLRCVCTEKEMLGLATLNLFHTHTHKKRTPELGHKDDPRLGARLREIEHN